MDQISAGHELRHKGAVSYAESEDSSSPASARSVSSFNDDPQTSHTTVTPDEEDSEDELQSDDVIHGMLIASAHPEQTLICSSCFSPDRH